MFLSLFQTFFNKKGQIYQLWRLTGDVQYSRKSFAFEKKKRGTIDIVILIPKILILIYHRSVQCGGENCPLMDLSKANLNFHHLQCYPNTMGILKWKHIFCLCLFYSYDTFFQDVLICLMVDLFIVSNDFCASDNWPQVGFVQRSLLPQAWR